VTTEPVRWGVLGAARIALDKVIPSMQAGELSRVVAIASRSTEKARAAAESLGIDRAYGSYQALIDDPDVEAIYNPLPNHLHVPWSIRAVRAGKHVLCEKPIGLSAREAVELRDAARQAGVLVGEAFMVRCHPQWVETRRLIDSGRIGTLQLVHGHFSYARRDATDVRSRLEYGGGALMDIGCYPITIARWMFGCEPLAAVAAVDRDPESTESRPACCASTPASRPSTAAGPWPRTSAWNCSAITDASSSICPSRRERPSAAGSSSTMGPGLTATLSRSMPRINTRSRAIVSRRRFAAVAKSRPRSTTPSPTWR
jgi:predicted dehydrogenase